MWSGKELKMGTNYYAVIDKCDCCGRGPDKIHIGKSSAGWPFSLHTTEHLKNWPLWREFIEKTDAPIVDEYGVKITIYDLASLIANTLYDVDWSKEQPGNVFKVYDDNCTHSPYEFC